jgi:phage tail-like protein
MTAASSYLTYLPPVLWPALGSAQAPAGTFGLGTMLCAFEKILTGIDDGTVITSGDNALLTTVIQNVSGAPTPQTVRVQAGTGVKFRVGSSYTYNGATPEVISITAAGAHTITAVIRQDHVANQTIVNSSGVHRDIQSVIAGLADLYGAWTTPAANVDWLAQWVALQSDPVWDDYARRSVLSTIVGIYTERGTKPGFDQFFDIYAIARLRPRVVVDDASKILFCQPQAGQIAPVPTIVSQRPLVAPQCMAMDPGGYLLVGDLGSGNSTIKPAIWRISPAGDYDYSAGPPPEPNPFQAANAPVAIAADRVNGGAYLIDLITNYVLYRCTAPQVGTVTLTGTPAAGATATFTIGGTSYPVPQTTGLTLTAQAAAWATALNAAAPFGTSYAATSSGPVISVTALSGEPGNDLTLVTTSSASLQLTAAGPSFATSAVFASDAAGPAPLGLIFPRAMVVDGAGHPLILDRGAGLSAPSQTAILDVQVNGTPPAYTGTNRNALPAIVEPLSMLLRADGSLIVGDGALQGSAAPADLFAVDTATWTATSLLSGMAATTNPLVSPVGIVEADTRHLWVLDAGLRPYVPSGVTPFTAVIAQQAAIYSVDLSVVPPVITRVSELGAGVYSRAMVGDGQGTLYICDSGLPDLAGYSPRLWRSVPQQMSVVVQFQGDPTRAIFCLTLSGVPTSGEDCVLTLASVAYPLAEVSGNSLVQQAAAWAQGLNGTASFNALYTALAIGNLICIYPVAGTNANGVPITAGSSASMTITGGRVAVAVTLAGVPTTGEQAAISLGGSRYVLDEATGQTLAQQATAWAATLNAATSFNQAYTAVAADSVLSLYYQSGDTADNLPFAVSSSVHLTLTPYSPPRSIGSASLSGIPADGESCAITLGAGSLPPVSFPLAETAGLTVAQQAAAWCGTLNGTPSFAASYVAVNAGGMISFFTAGPVSNTVVTLSALSSPHLFIQVYSELQNRSQFLQSIRDVLSDEIPAHARWYVQSGLSTL